MFWASAARDPRRPRPKYTFGVVGYSATCVSINQKMSRKGASWRNAFKSGNVILRKGSPSGATSFCRRANGFSSRPFHFVTAQHDVCSWHKADILGPAIEVRFVTLSGRSPRLGGGGRKNSRGRCKRTAGGSVSIINRHIERIFRDRRHTWLRTRARAL
jgi:hypothetical protein